MSINETFLNDFSKKILDGLREVIYNDEYNSVTELKAGSTIVDNSGNYNIPITVKNIKADFDMFTYIIVLSETGNNIYISTRYNNQNTSNVNDIGEYSSSQDEQGYVQQIVSDFSYLFENSKEDFKRLAR